MIRSLLLAALCAVCGGAAAQQQLELPFGSEGQDGDSSTNYPWNRRNDPVRLQLCYDSTELTAATSISGPISIGGLRFRAANGSDRWVGGTYQSVGVYVGESAVDFRALSPTFASNWPGGVRPAAAYQGPVVIEPGQAVPTAGAGPFYIDIRLTSPVLYDPTSGSDLLLEFAIPRFAFAGTDSTLTESMSSLQVSQLARRVYALDSDTATTGVGPFETGTVVELDYTPTTGLSPFFTADVQRVGPGEVVQFQDRSFSADPGGITGWSWDLDGDGSPDSTDRNPSWTYSSCGLVDVTLTVTDGQHAPMAITRPDFVTVGPPIARFAVDVSSGTNPLTVQFTDLSRGRPTAWAWDFENDGTVDSTIQNPQWTFSEGVFDVKLRVTNACGVDDELTGTAVFVYSALCTTSVGGNSLASGGGSLFDVDITSPDGVMFREIDVVATSTGSPVTIDVYVTDDTYAGNADDPMQWVKVATGSAIAAGPAPATTRVDITDFFLPSGQYGLGIHVTGSGVEYTVGNGANQFYSSADLSLTLGAVQPALFGGGVVGSRVWNGCLHYDAASFAPAFNVFREGCPGSLGVPTIEGLNGSVPRLDSVFAIHLRGAFPNSAAMFVVGLDHDDYLGIPLPTDLTAFGLEGCRLHVSLDAEAVLPTTAAGKATLALTVPNSPVFVGAEFFTQALVIDPGAATTLGASMSDAAVGRIGR